MKSDPNKIINRAISKAKQSTCNYRVVAIALDKNGKFIGIKANRIRSHQNLKNEYRNSHHAEELLIHSMKPNIIHTILIGRIGRSGKLLPIDPCSNCAKLAEKYNIKIERI